MAAGCIQLRSEKVHFKPTVSCSLAPNSHHVSLGRKPHGGGDSSCSSSSSSALVPERACSFWMFIIAIFARDAGCSGSANRPSGGRGEGLTTTTTRAAGRSLAWLEPAISRLLDGASPGRPSAGTEGLGWGRLYACLPSVAHPPPSLPPDSGSPLPVPSWPWCNIAFVSLIY